MPILCLMKLLYKVKTIFFGERKTRSPKSRPIERISQLKIPVLYLLYKIHQYKLLV